MVRQVGHGVGMVLDRGTGRGVIEYEKASIIRTEIDGCLQPGHSVALEDATGFPRASISGGGVFPEDTRPIDGGSASDCDVQL